MEYKIALVYTGMPVKLVKMVEEELTARFEGDKLTFITLSDPSIIADAVKNGSPSKEAAGRLLGMYAQALSSGADVILNICSSVGDIAGAAQDAFALAGVPMVRIDEKMAQEAVRKFSKIGVIATLSSTLEPTKRLIRACAEKAGRQIELFDALADNAFGGGAEPLIEAAKKLQKAECIVLAQGSMGDSREAVEKASGKPTFASPFWGALGVYEAVKA